jgi:hypothetical protein
MMPEEKAWHGAIRVIDGSNDAGGRLYLNVDSARQTGALYLGVGDPGPASPTTPPIKKERT